MVGGLNRERRDARLLAVVLMALPVWWALGLAAVAPMLVAAWLGLSLLRQPSRIQLPGGFTWWLLFLIWALLGVVVLWVDAPLAQSGG